MKRLPLALLLMISAVFAAAQDKNLSTLGTKNVNIRTGDTYAYFNINLIKDTTQALAGKQNYSVKYSFTGQKALEAKGSMNLDGCNVSANVAYVAAQVFAKDYGEARKKAGVPPGMVAGQFYVIGAVDKFELKTAGECTFKEIYFTRGFTPSSYSGRISDALMVVFTVYVKDKDGNPSSKKGSFTLSNIGSDDQKLQLVTERNANPGELESLSKRALK